MWRADVLCKFRGKRGPASVNRARKSYRCLLQVCRNVGCGSRISIGALIIFVWPLFHGRLREPSQDYRSELMDKKKLEGFKKRLETRQQDLRRTVSRTQADGRSADEDTAQDIADRAASSYTKEFLFSQSNNERQLLQMVDKALARIREGSFGECIHCGKEINAKRLEAVPWTRHCIECQEKLEQGLLEEAPR